MDPRFQTSFIPKKSLAQPGSSITGASRKKRGAISSIFMIFAVVLFVASLAAAGGAYFWKQILLSSRNQYQKELTDRENQFNPTLINQLKESNIKIDTAKLLLSNHLAASEVFGIVGSLTAANIRFLSMTLAATKDSGGGLNLGMNGYGANFSAIAFQSEVLGRLEQYGLRNVVKNPIISNPSLGTNGTVSFGLSATIDPSNISYEKSVLPSSPVTTTP